MAKNLNIGNFLTISRSNISKLQIFLKISSSNVRPKTKQIIGAVFEKNIKVSDFGLTWRLALSLFYLYSPLISCKKSEKSLEPFLRKLRYQQTNQPTNYYQQHRFIDLADAGPKRDSNRCFSVNFLIF